MLPVREASSKARLMDAATQVIRSKGYSATTVEDICHAATLTKGSFFHHFKSKDDLALATVLHWNATTEQLFADADYRKARDPLDRLLGYVEFRSQLLSGELCDYTCLLGTLVQEVYDTHPKIRAACDQGFSSHIAELTRDLQAAKALYAPSAPWSPESVGVFIQSLLQGSFIFAKSKQTPDVVRANLQHLRRYLSLLLPRRTRAAS
jgi:TetR/AcrR family transcriptional repressor of nem operon